MRRTVLITAIVFGGLLSLLGVSGAFAAFSDTAQTGQTTPERVSSGARLKEADIKVGVPVSGSCAATADNLPTGVMNSTSLAAGQSSGVSTICVRNLGAQPVTLRFQTVQIQNVDTACTGDEGVVDATCGNNGAGELGDVLQQLANVNPTQSNCDQNVGLDSATGTVNFHPVYVTTTPIAPGHFVCFNYEFQLPAGTGNDIVRAQSDEVRFRWNIDSFTTDGGSGSTTTTINNF